jgi:ABC-type Fe3+/spermidine/putrescine transport system ATPase subunit
MTTATDGIRLRGLSRSYGETVVLDSLNLDVPAGCLFTLLGPSGCGKSTTLNLVAGLDRPTAGEIWIGGEQVYSKRGNLVRPPEARGLGMVFQSYALWPHMTILQNVAFGLRRRGLRKKDWAARAMEALDLVQLSSLARRYPHELSGGQQQRVALARAVACRPRALLFDEPLSNLDARLQEEMRAELKNLHRELGFTAIYVTHNQEEALVLSDRVAVMWSGRVIQEGTPTELYGQPASLDVANFLGKYNRLRAKRLRGTDVALPELGITFAADPDAVARLDGDEGVLCVRPQEVALRPPGGPTCGVLCTATVQSRAYLGAYYDYSLLAGTVPLIARTSTTCVFDTGDEVEIVIDTARALLLPGSTR